MKFLTFISVATMFMSAWSMPADVAKPCSTCTDNICILVPPEGANFPCYEGTNDDASFCYTSDPLLKDGTTWACGVCKDLGYTKFLHNDPIYKNMALWTK